MSDFRKGDKVKLKEEFEEDKEDYCLSSYDNWFIAREEDSDGDCKVEDESCEECYISTHKLEKVEEKVEKPKFSVGNRVKIPHANNHNSHVNGRVGNIERLDLGSNFQYKVVFDDGSMEWVMEVEHFDRNSPEDETEKLIESETMEKEEIKNLSLEVRQAAKEKVDKEIRDKQEESAANYYRDKVKEKTELEKDFDEKGEKIEELKEELKVFD